MDPEHLNAWGEVIVIILDIHFIVTKYDMVGSGNAWYSGFLGEFSQPVLVVRHIT